MQFLKLSQVNISLSLNSIRRGVEDVAEYSSMYRCWLVIVCLVVIYVAFSFVRIVNDDIRKKFNIGLTPVQDTELLLKFVHLKNRGRESLASAYISCTRSDSSIYWVCEMLCINYATSLQLYFLSLSQNPNYGDFEHHQKRAVDRRILDLTSKDPSNGFVAHQSLREMYGLAEPTKYVVASTVSLHAAVHKPQKRVQPVLLQS